MMESFNELVTQSLENQSVLAVFFVFAAGVLTSFTPCVYPVVPITVGFVSSQAGDSRLRGFFLSLTYVLGMAIVYTVFAMVLVLVLETFIGSFWATGWAKLLVAALCLAFALSMFGLYELKLPDKWMSRIPHSTRYGGFVGALLVGALSGLIVGPCTAPVLGGILAVATESGSVFYAGTMLFSFSLGLGTLLVIAGTFAGFMVALPKGGKWMVGIKIALGLGLLAVAAYYSYLAYQSF